VALSVRFSTLLLLFGQILDSTKWLPTLVRVKINSYMHKFLSHVVDKEGLGCLLQTEKVRCHSATKKTPNETTEQMYENLRYRDYHTRTKLNYLSAANKPAKAQKDYDLSFLSIP
jgi:hypothetical protein